MVVTLIPRLNPSTHFVDVPVPEDARQELAVEYPEQAGREVISVPGTQVTWDSMCACPYHDMGGRTVVSGGASSLRVDLVPNDDLLPPLIEQALARLREGLERQRTKERELLEQFRSVREWFKEHPGQHTAGQTPFDELDLKAFAHQGLLTKSNPGVSYQRKVRFSLPEEGSE
jgi:hypothetical protein